MATGAKLSIMGLYNYNPEIFDDLTLPAGIDKETVIDNILMECYDFELLFPSYNLMKIGIRTWSRTELPIWEKLYNTENLEYNPIWNVDGDVTETREVTRERSGEDGRTITNSGNSSETVTGSRETETGKTNNTTTTDTTSGTSENTHSQAGYNSSALVVTEKDSGTTGTTGSGSRTENETGSEDETYSENRSGSNGGTETHSGTNSENETVGESLHTRRTGNIGVTTTQQMIREERDVVTFSTIKYITDSFKQRLCLLVY